MTLITRYGHDWTAIGEIDALGRLDGTRHHIEYPVGRARWVVATGIYEPIDLPLNWV